jgi:hypothetical protein
MNAAHQLRDQKLILVEGMPGTGKSTVAQFVSTQLRAAGRPSSWCHEERAAHPVALFYEHRSWAEYVEEAVKLWSSCADELRSGHQIAVLDGAVMQNHARSMLLFGCPWDPILELVRRVEVTIAPLHPVWIYLKPADVENNFRHIVELRGARLLELWLRNQDQFPYATRARAFGFPGFIAFWKEFDELCDRVFDVLSIGKLRPNTSLGNWDIRRGEILNFLGQPFTVDSVSPVELERFTGEYMPSRNQSSGAFALHAKEGCLIMTCSDPTIDVHRGPIGCYREVRLIPKDKNRFSVESWPHEVEFVEDSLGAVASMRLTALEEGWSQSGEEYLRANRALTR